MAHPRRWLRARLREGGLDQAKALEDHDRLITAITHSRLGPHFYRIAKPGEL